MAITTTTITKTAGWGRTDVIDQLEDAFTWLTLHGTAISGMVTSMTAYDGGGSVGSVAISYYDVPSTSSGSGTGASFDVTREVTSGNVSRVMVNRPGKDYAESEFLTISADDIGGTGNGAVAIGVTVSVDGQGSPVSYGGAGQFFDKNFSPTGDSTRPWGVLKQDFDTTKKYGTTYRGIKVYSDNKLAFYVGNSFFPFDHSNSSDLGGDTRDSFRGTGLLDIIDPNDWYATLDGDRDNYAQADGAATPYFATTNAPTTHDLKLNIYRSSIDTDFAVLSFNQPSISGTIDNETFLTLIVHNFDSSLWDYDEVFSAGLTFIGGLACGNSDGANTSVIGFKTVLSGNFDSASDYRVSLRTAEAGWIQARNQSYHQANVVQDFSIAATQTNYTSSMGASDLGILPSNTEATIFSRNGSGFKSQGMLENVGSNIYGNRDPITTYTSVIKGIPINGNLIPCPYYMPDDFVLIDFNLPTSEQVIRQGDTITISGSEIYTVITGSYNQYGETAGILFCARTT